jgi:predicted transcriptional regulator
MPSNKDLLQEPPLPASAFFALVDEGMHGMMRTAALTAAVEFSLFDILIQPHDFHSIARQTEIPESILEPFLELLCEMGLLVREGVIFRDSRISSVYLYSESPFSQVIYMKKNARFMRDIWCRLDSVLKDGPVVYPRDLFFSELTLPAMAENARCGRLQKTANAISALPGFSNFRRMVDLGGGHGLYAIALAELNPFLEAYVFDLPHIIPLAEEYIKSFDAERVHAIAGDFFRDDFGKQYDLILSSSSPSGKSIEILPKIADALNSGGFFVNVQSAGDHGKDIYQALEWQLWAIDGMDKVSGAYTKERPFMTSEYRQAMEASGFVIWSEKKIRDDYHADSMVDMVIAKKA